MADQAILDVPNQPRKRRMLKRTLETAAVASPIVIVLAGVAMLSGSIRIVPETWIFLFALAVLAAGVFTQHWVAYVVLLAAAVVFFLSTGLLALAAWIFGAIYAAIALVNLIPRLRRR